MSLKSCEILSNMLGLLYITYILCKNLHIFEGINLFHLSKEKMSHVRYSQENTCHTRSYILVNFGILPIVIYH